MLLLRHGFCIYVRSSRLILLHDDRRCVLSILSVRMVRVWVRSMSRLKDIWVYEYYLRRVG